MDTTGMGTPVISVYKKVWCSTIRGCGTIKIISGNKDKTLQIVPQCGTIRGCGTIRVNAVSVLNILSLKDLLIGLRN